MLVLNQKHLLHSAKELNQYPHWVKSADRQSLAQFDHILWVCHPVNGVWWPWLVESTVKELLTQIDYGIETLSLTGLAYAQTLGLLIDPERVSADRAVFEQAIVACRAQIVTDRYCKLPRITFDNYDLNVDGWVAAVWSQFYTDVQCPGRRAFHSPQLFNTVHAQISELVQMVADQAIKPSYCYLGHYEPGAVLTRHTDRPQCRWNASICFARTSDIWPIYVETNGQAVPINADIGEIIVYPGNELPHWRDALPSGTNTVVFFHFVVQNFQDELR